MLLLATFIIFIMNLDASYNQVIYDGCWAWFLLWVSKGIMPLIIIWLQVSLGTYDDPRRRMVNKNNNYLVKYWLATRLIYYIK